MNAKQGKNQDYLQRVNRSLIMRLIHQKRVCSRAELAKLSGLTTASITGITQYLIRIGVVKEIGLIEGAKGRRSIGLTLCMDSYLCVGIRLTRKHIHGGLFDIAGEIYAEEMRDIAPGSTPSDAMGLVKEIIAILLGKADDRKILGIGMALPGPIIFRENKIAYMSAFPGWEQMDIKGELERTFHLPVLLEHDGVCFALSEWWNRDNENYKLMLCVLVGQGVGAGIIEEGRPIRGADGCAGEIGHMSLYPDGPRCDCGNYGCLEMYASTLALEREMAIALQTRPEHPLYGAAPGYREIFSCIRQGDALSTQLFVNAAWCLGHGLVNLINFLNPDVVVVTDEMAECAELLKQVIDEVLSEQLSPKIRACVNVIVKPANRHSAMQAATSLIIDSFLDHPSEFTNV